MNKNCKVNIDFITTLVQADKKSVVDLKALGTLVRNDVTEKLYFQSKNETSLFQMEIITSNGNIKIKQQQPNLATLEFDVSKKTQATYTTEFGALELAIRTTKLVTKPGYILVEYYLEDSQSNNERNRIEINYKESS
jgi:uncharacterized beta-barrel protein YwiB (DUF1934 family)